MAITRRWQSGFELSSLDEITDNNASVVTSTDRVKTGTYSLRVSLNNSFDQWATVSFPATRQIRAGMFVNVNGNGADVQFLRVLGSITPVEILLNGTTMKLKVLGVEQDVAPGAYIKDAWFHIGVDVYVHSSSGWVKIYIDGVETLSFSGNTGNADIYTLYLCTPGGIGGWGYSYWDDMYIDDTTGEGAAAVCPILNFPLVSPDGAGNYTQWSPSAGNNWDAVNEIPPSDADYVETDVVDEFDSYTMGNYTLGTGETIDAVIPIARAKRDGTSEQIALGTRYSATDLVGSDQNPSTTYYYLWERQTTKPGGGTWDQTSINGFETIIKSRGTY